MKKILSILLAILLVFGACACSEKEVEETIECLKGLGPEDVMTVTYALGSQMLQLAGKASSNQQGIDMCKEVVDNGKALELFLKNVELQKEKK